jgi:hypothetical protein
MLVSKYVEVDVASLKTKAGTLTATDESAKEMANQFMNRMYKVIGIVFVLYFTAIHLSKSHTLIEIAGTLSSGFEALVPVPQFISNLKSKSVLGLRYAY